ncbi:MAG TPA: polysaccharide deacetylase family protein, partial [Polyangia bacterium]|nr:polysaccharide deacetylase family protein [Polyangia bacterium]
MNGSRERGKALRRLKRIAGHLARTSGVQALGRWYRGNPLILMYHGVTRAPSRGLLNCEGKHVGVDRFVEQLRFLKRHRRVIPLDALVSGVVTGADMRGAVAITFDDGYENNVTQAAPVLAELKMPATFFLATGYVDADRWMWVDKLEFVLNHTTCSALTLEGIGHVGLEDKREALRVIKRFAKQQPQEILERLVAVVDEQCGVSSEAPAGDHRFMTWAQARALKGSGFEIGAHTVSHPMLSRVELAQAEREMVDSRAAIRRELGVCSEIFCYPNGKTSDYTPQIIACAARHFQAAL